MTEKNLRYSNGDNYEMIESNRLTYIDTAKGIGILLVVYAHIILLTGKFPELEWIIKYIYSFHMPLFFLLSGSCFRIKFRSKKESSLKTELIHAGDKLLKSYFVWSFI